MEVLSVILTEILALIAEVPPIDDLNDVLVKVHQGRVNQHPFVVDRGTARKVILVANLEVVVYDLNNFGVMNHVVNYLKKSKTEEEKNFK